MAATNASSKRSAPVHLDHTIKPGIENNNIFHVQQASSLRRRVDMRLIPALGLMYGISLMDRKNVSNTAIAGMRTGLDLLEGYRYSLITLSFFITYAIFQAPMTVICPENWSTHFSTWYLLGAA